MANPQTEDGHIDIANEIAEALARTQLNGYESRYLWVLWRKTYGWHKKSDHIPISQVAKLTGLKKQHIWRTQQRLLQRNIIIKNGYKTAFQKDYTQWRELPKMVTNKKVTKNGKKVINSGKKVIKNGGLKRNSSKETTQKKKYAEFVQMSEKEHGKLIEKYGEEKVQEMIEKLDNYKGSKGRTYRSDYRAILSWVAEEIMGRHEGDIDYQKL